MPEVVIFDGYIDEPGSLGVPPYIHPLPRAVFGATRDTGGNPHYLTVDQWRKGKKIPPLDLLVVLSGMSVPGRYLRGMPASRRELLQLIDGYRGETVLGGPAALDPSLKERFHHVHYLDAAAAVHDLMEKGRAKDRWRSNEEWDRWMLLGADCVLAHPDHPQPLTAELETYRGCVRYVNGGCSFCVEPLKGRPVFREPEAIVAEARALRDRGVVNFRLGSQTCIISYKAELDGTDCPRPNPEALEALLSGMSSLSPNVLHVDNANPAVMARHPEEAEKILASLVEHCTSGNVLALGMETADPEVGRINNLNATPEEVLWSVRAINRAGGKRGDSGLPMLLPGINVLVGLEGEKRETLEINYRFLKGILDEGLLLRRINIRQVMPVRREFPPTVSHSEFLRFKDRIRQEIDRPLLERLVPVGTVLRSIYTEMREGKVAFGRQIGTYPLLIGIPHPVELERFYDVAVVGHGFRSVSAVQYPLNVNSCHITALEALPGLGRKRAIRLFRARPIEGREDLRKALDDPRVADAALPFLSFDLPEH
ncbi:MAG TPA: radical SAM protein [Methanomassiliicoccales archaeon]|nr:radical SAM protein [Methanomassiliicoccales archaeon]